MLKKILLLSIIFLSFSFSVFAESIKNYEVNIELKKDSSMIVEEKITYDFGDIQRHGIYRFIPNSFQVEGQKKLFGLKERKLKFSNLKVFQDGQPANIAELNKDDSNNNYFIKIGESHRLISGVHKYIIKYRVDGSIRYFKDYDEIYWNAIGLDWKVPIENAKVIVNSDNIDFKNKSCYKGKLKSSNNCNVIGNVFSTSNLNPGEGMTVALSLKKGAVLKNEIWGMSSQGIIVIVIGIIFSIIGGLIIFIRKYLNKYKIDKPIIPIYKPYKNFHPALTGYLIDRKLDSRDLTAGILSLAQKGYIEIERIEEKGILFGINTEYIFRLKKKLSEVKDDLDKFFIKLIFTNSGNLDEIIGTINTIIKTGSINNSLDDHTDILNEVKLSDLKDRATDILGQKRKIDTWLKKYSTDNGYLESKNVVNIYVIVFLIISIIIVIFFVGFDFLPIIVFFFIFAFIFVVAIISSRYTKKGWKVKNNLEGFKMFLEYTEKERIKYFNSPETNPREFLDYLPYATAFGVEKKWKEQFKNITIPKPDWYVGPGPFVAANMMSDISSVTDSITSTMATTATSGSGSGGGGFSGGGGGGGGGGSW